MFSIIIKTDFNIDLKTVINLSLTLEHGRASNSGQIQEFEI